MKIIRLLGLLLCIFSCQESTSTTRKHNYPICIDSMDGIPRMLAFEDSKGIYKYNLLYIGEEKDSLFIDYKLGLSLVSGPPPPPPPPLNDSERQMMEEDTFANIAMEEAWEEWSKRRETFDPYFCGNEEWTGSCNDYKHVIMDSAKASIVVDTNHYILSYDWTGGLNEGFKAYPVIIKNTQKDTMIIATSNHIELVLEGQGKDGWESLIEPTRHLGCGNGLTYLLLPPNEILVTSVPVYKWKKRTLLRLKLGENYSTIFTGNKIVD